MRAESILLHTVVLVVPLLYCVLFLLVAAASLLKSILRPCFVLQVPVYEFKIDGDNVMRRRADDWINATHILKVAGFDKPARTRILEREVQKGVHEKVQGGYGKYQGIWNQCWYARDW